MSNWVVGYPAQADREIDLMYESESARLWEEQNSKDEQWNKLLNAVGYINVVLEHLDKVTDGLALAKQEVEGIPAEYKVGSLLDSFEDLNCDLNKLRERFIKGEW